LVSQCANPNCGEPFLYLRNGRLFVVPRQRAPETHATIEYFWLCKRCAETMEAEFGRHDHHLTLVARERTSIHG
jgi:hypothetical protein